VLEKHVHHNSQKLAMSTKLERLSQGGGEVGLLLPPINSSFNLDRHLYSPRAALYERLIWIFRSSLSLNFLSTVLRNNRATYLPIVAGLIPTVVS
jgi:hypothetical protein